VQPSLALILRRLLEEFTSLEAIAGDARAQGYVVAGMSREMIIDMTKLAAQPHPPSIGERLGIVRWEGQTLQKSGFSV
jgi:hypothetical protein